MDFFQKPEEMMLNIFNANGMDQVRQVYEKADNPEMVFDFVTLGNRTQLIVADSSQGVNVKSNLCVSCEGIEGYLGTVLVHFNLEAYQIATRCLIEKNWKIVRFRFHWFESLHGKLSYQQSRVFYSGEGKFWKSIRMIWIPGLPSHDDYDIQSDVWRPEDVANIQ
jgi:hypothetical protein